MRATDPFRHPWYVVAAVVGAGAAVAVYLVAERAGIPVDEAYAGAMTNALVVGGFLLVPASIFPAVVGAMFPQYWNATPDRVIRDAPMSLLLVTLAAVVGYGSVALLLPPSGPLAAGLVALVAIGGTLAVLLIAYSLSLLDPMQVLERLRRESLASDDDTARDAFGDLCRFVRGMAERKRLHVATAGIGYMGEAWRARHGAMPARHRGLARNVLDDCAATWQDRPRPELIAAIDACRVELGAHEPGHP